MRCQCLTKSGTQCSRNASDGSPFCYQHQNCSKRVTESPSKKVLSSGSQKSFQTGETVKTKPVVSRSSHPSVSQLLAKAPAPPTSRPSQPIEPREVTRAQA